MSGTDFYYESLRSSPKIVNTVPGSTEESLLHQLRTEAIEGAMKLARYATSATSSSPSTAASTAAPWALSRSPHPNPRNERLWRAPRRIDTSLSQRIPLRARPHCRNLRAKSWKH